MAQSLEGRVAIVTGGGHGIGKAYCEALAQNGAAIVVAEIDGDAAFWLARQCSPRCARRATASA